MYVYLLFLAIIFSPVNVILAAEWVSKTYIRPEGTSTVTRNEGSTVTRPEGTSTVTRNEGPTVIPDPRAHQQLPDPKAQQLPDPRAHQQLPDPRAQQAYNERTIINDSLNLVEFINFSEVKRGTHGIELFRLVTN